MLRQFFKLAAVSPGRHSAFRTLVLSHLVLVTAGAAVALSWQEPQTPLLGHVALVAGIVEGALLIGWRLTQLPKSQSLEFLLVSPLRPRQLLVAEALVGLTQLVLVTLSALPLYLLLALDGSLWFSDLPALLLMPWTWGAITGFTLVTWAFEGRLVRRWGERVVMVLIVFYLTVGVLAGEQLGYWLADLPTEMANFLLNGVRAFHAYSPFTVLRDVLRDRPGEVIGRFAILEAIALLLLAVLLVRSAARLQGHFQDRHYSPVADVSRQRRAAIGNKPLSWWAVKRVSEYAGRVNLWLAGGFALLYAAYTVAGSAWPSWLGRQVFLTFDQLGGIPALATALVVLAAVPAAFQYGLWDSNAQDRCRRLELLLLTDLDAHDYWHAAAAAAWRRGRGYLAVAVVLWAALVLSGKADVLQVVAAGACGVILWVLYFALGFRAFARGMQANGLGMVLTVGVPVSACLLIRLDLTALAHLLPPASVYGATTTITGLSWLAGPLLAGALALVLACSTQRRCVADLRRWYDQHHGLKGQA